MSISGGIVAAGMDRLFVRAGGPLSGTVEINGAKNSVLKCMAGCLLATGHHHIGNVPAITDVSIMADVLAAMGATTVQAGAGVQGTLDIDVPASITPVAPYELVDRIRASIVVLGPLLARYGYAKVSMPGGDDFGERPIDMHLRAFEELGTEFTAEHGYVEGRCDRLVGTRIVLEYPSHTATDNVLMAAVLAKGTTIIENAAREPEVSDLAAMLTGMGARIEGAGTSHVEVEGVDELRPANHSAIPDRVEAATFLAAVGLAGGAVQLEHARPEHMDMLLHKLGAIGVHCVPNSGGLLATSDGALSSVDVSTLPYPGVATDYKPALVTLLSVADGVAIVSENIFAGRFRYIDELRRMGARISIEGHHAVVRGVPRLSGAQVRAPDIRAGAALVLAGLVADGVTEVSGVEHIDRGYEDFHGRLQALGADVTRVAGDT
ncbi:MAG: UDP-N-acetylglucosamine 1-carboxyvinyltransferase [Acidimicrobiales bacterium]|jgi:UDP-N-acetylglucosamine 1-carboxyvinyltransferase